MKLLQDKLRVEAPSAEFPYGNLIDETGVNDGTAVNREFLTDIVQFFEKAVDEAGVVPNGIVDNEYDGWQLYEAFRKLTKPYKVLTGLLTQSGTNAPTVTILGINEIGTPVMAYDSPGFFGLTITGAFINGKTTYSISTGINGFDEAFLINFLNEDLFIIKTYTGGALANDVLLNTPFEIRVYD
jgi:hypothetical protein